VTAREPFLATSVRRSRRGIGPDLAGGDVDRMAWTLAGLRILAGVIWLANQAGKLPPNFGKDDPEGLLYSFQRAEQYAVLEPLRNLVHDVVIPHFTLFGWLVFGVELAAGLFLTLGFMTRLGGLIGTGQAIIITALIVRAPDEWFWTYAMLVILNSVSLFAPTSARLSIDRFRRER
jgi:thiosulfate dehydrogenase [quinone] large subunit